MKIEEKFYKKMWDELKIFSEKLRNDDLKNILKTKLDKLEIKYYLKSKQ